MEDTLTFSEFVEHVNAEGYLCLPARYQAGYQLKTECADGEYRLMLAGEKESLDKLPYLNLKDTYERCGRRFDIPVFCRILEEYTSAYASAYEEALMEDQKEQRMYAGLIQEFPKRRICFLLVPYREDIRKSHPGRRYGDVFMLYAVLMEDEVVQLITDALMNKWGVTEQELRDTAEKNMPALFPYDYEKIRLVGGEDVFVISSMTRWFGLGTVLYEDGPLKELAMTGKSDYIIFPLSVHEAVAFPEGMIEEKELYRIAEEISPYKGVWHYSRVLNRTAFTGEERMEQEMILKQGIVDAGERRLMNGYKAIGRKDQ